MADPQSQPPEGPRLGLTRRRDLGLAALVGVVAGWVLVTVVQAVTGQPPQLPWLGPLVLFFVAALVAGLAWTTWRRVQVRHERVDSQQAVTWLAFGKACALGGAAIAGGYLMLAVLSLTGNITAEGPQQRLVRGLVAAVAGVLITAAGLWLERACKVPEPPEDEENEETA